MEFPVLFYVIPKPGLDPVNLALQGYEGAYPYFLGMKNQSTFGWAAANKTVKGKVFRNLWKTSPSDWTLGLQSIKYKLTKISPLNEV